MTAGGQPTMALLPSQQSNATEKSMSIAEIITAIQALSCGEKRRLVHLLLDDLANEEPQPVFKEGHVYPIYTPEFAPNVATQLAQVIDSTIHQSVSLP